MWNVTYEVHEVTEALKYPLQISTQMIQGCKILIPCKRLILVLTTCVCVCCCGKAGIQRGSVGRSHSQEQTGWFTGSEKALGDQYVALHRQLIKSAALRNVLNYLWLLMDPSSLTERQHAAPGIMPKTCTRVHVPLSKSPTHSSKHESLFMHDSMCPEHTDAWRSFEPRCLICKQFVTAGSYLHSFEGYDRWGWLHAFLSTLTNHHSSRLISGSDTGPCIRGRVHQIRIGFRSVPFVCFNLFIICQWLGIKVMQTNLVCLHIFLLFQHFLLLLPPPPPLFFIITRCRFFFYLNQICDVATPLQNNVACDHAPWHNILPG